jgi:hypothetical protein
MEDDPERSQDSAFLESVTLPRVVACRRSVEASSVSCRMQELVQERRVIPVISSHPIHIGSIPVDGNNVGLDEVRARVPSPGTASELTRWDSEVRTEIARHPQRVK